VLPEAESPKPRHLFYKGHKTQVVANIILNSKDVMATKNLSHPSCREINASSAKVTKREMKNTAESNVKLVIKATVVHEVKQNRTGKKKKKERKSRGNSPNTLCHAFFWVHLFFLHVVSCQLHPK
jgi:hypothetical protein